MKILIADDDPVSVLFLEDALKEWGYDVLIARDGRTACDILLEPNAPMMAVIDWMMPGMDGLEVCRTVREKVNDHYIYLLMLTSRTETAFIVEAMDNGADDYISKPFDLDELKVRLRAGKRICELERELRIKATSDALTGIYNRGAILDILQREIVRHERQNPPMGIIMADIDHFKRTNDRYGHPAGDAVLREVACRVAASLRPYDALGRYGGEELLIVLPSCDEAGALDVAERIRALVAQEPVQTEAGPVSVTLSLGVAVASDDVPISMHELVQRADRALYRAKERGRNRVEHGVADRISRHALGLLEPDR